MKRLRAFIGVIGFALALAPGPAAAATPAPFGHQCTMQADGTRFCPTTDLGPGQTADGVPTWDGVPLDVDVTLPPSSFGDGPFPTVVMLHGWGGDKTDFGSTNAGDTAKLVLLGRDAPYLRASNDTAFTVTVSKVTVTLPTR